jgi:hypothetical protein
MLDKKKMAALFAPIVVVALAAGVAADAEATRDRFVFTPAAVGESNSTDKGPWEIVVTRWSTDDEREAVMSAVGTDAPDRLRDVIARGQDAGYISLPGYLRYTLRYAHRIPRADGGEDIVLATERPIWWWWDSTRSMASTKAPVSVIQLRLSPDGSGEGKLSLESPIGRDGNAKSIVLEQYGSQPTLLTGVRRATT